MNHFVLQSLDSFPRIQVIEAYTGRHLQYRTGTDGLDVKRFAEVRFRAEEMPVIFYETDHALNMIRNKKIGQKQKHQLNRG